MKKTNLILILALLCLCTDAAAQTFQEGFFLRNYRQAYRYNPALTGTTNFIGIGEVTYNTRANVGAAAFLYPREGGLVTALHSSVEAGEFLNQLKDDNYTLGSINANLFAYGFRTGQFYHTLEASVRGYYGAAVPKSIFQFLKTGSRVPALDFKGMGGSGKLYAELAYGFGVDLGDFVSLGARAKLLVGLYAVDAGVDRMDVWMSEDKLSAGISVEADLTSETGWRKRLPKGMGAAFDLGVAIRPVEGLTISASVLDLGGLFWNYASVARSAGDVSFTGVNNLTYEELNAAGLLKRVVNAGKEWWKELKPEHVKRGWTFNAIPFQANAGIKYVMPFYDRLNVGVIGQYNGYAGRPYWEARFGVGVNPLKWLDLSANIGRGSFGTVFGVAGSVCIGRFRIQGGLQNGFGGTIPYEGTPLQPNSKTITFGLTYDI